MPMRVIQSVKKVMGRVRYLRKTVERYGAYDFEYVADSAGMTSTPRGDRAAVDVDPSTRQERGSTVPCHTCGNTVKDKEGDIAERMFLEDLRRNTVNENLTERRNLSE